MGRNQAELSLPDGTAHPDRVPSSLWSKARELLADDGWTKTARVAARFAYGSLRLAYLRRLAKADIARTRVQDWHMFTRVNDPGIGSNLIRLGYHEKTSTQAMREYLLPGKSVVDIGANIGYYALLEAQRVGSSGKVYAIEPVPDNYDLLVRNVELNDLNDVISTFPIAIGDRTGTATMNRSRFMSRHSFLPRESEDLVGTLDVPMVPFDDFVSQHDIDLSRLALVRMDVEGFEARILPTMERTLQRCRQLAMHIEFHPQYIDMAPGCSFRDTLKYLRSFDARFRWLLVHDGSRKRLLLDMPIDDVLNSHVLMSKHSIETWIDICH